MGKDRKAAKKADEDRIRRIYEESVQKYGKEHTHDFRCRTWRGQNWAGACNCSLSNKQTKEQ